VIKQKTRQFPRLWHWANLVLIQSPDLILFFISLQLVRARASGIPVYAMIVRQSLKEVLAPITDAVTNSVDEVIKRIKGVIRERKKEGDTLFVVGVRNTIGIA
jgi:hypothetical protein